MNTPLKCGDVVCFRFNDSKVTDGLDALYFKLIRVGNYLTFGKDGWTNSINHVGIISGFETDSNGDKCVTVYEALDKGVVHSPYPIWWINTKVDDGNIVILRPKLQVYTIDKYCKQYEGVPYDWASIIALFILITTKKRISILEKSKGAHTQFCSEFVLRVLYDASNKQIDLEKEFNRDFDRLMPMHIFYSDHFVAIY